MHWVTSQMQVSCPFLWSAGGCDGCRPPVRDPSLWWLELRSGCGANVLGLITGAKDYEGNPIIRLHSYHHPTALIPPSHCCHHIFHYINSIIPLLSFHHPTALIPSSHCSQSIIPLLSSRHSIALIPSSHCSHPIFPVHSSHHPTALIPSAKKCHGN